MNKPLIHRIKKTNKFSETLVVETVRCWVFKRYLWNMCIATFVRCLRLRIYIHFNLSEWNQCKEKKITISKNTRVAQQMTIFRNRNELWLFPIRILDKCTFKCWIENLWFYDSKHDKLLINYTYKYTTNGLLPLTSFA